MGTPFLAEIKIISWNFAPQGWAFANGQLLPINQNQALFSLMGTTYGGNGQTNFALPDLRNRIPLHWGSSFTLGEKAGEDAHTLTMSEMPAHNHFVVASAPANAGTNVITVAGNYFSNSAPAEIYNTGAGNPPLIATAGPSVSNYGGSQPHSNLQPYLVLNFIVALVGIFPSQN
ncbi:MAG TPA: tail fiber protein [Saprospiraceae bacterium]|nr:tail fiber protein [Saprospiraceae bacterium]